MTPSERLNEIEKILSSNEIGVSDDWPFETIDWLLSRVKSLTQAFELQGCNSACVQCLRMWDVRRSLGIGNN